MANVIKTVLTYQLDGSKRDFNIPFEYLARKFVVVTLIGVDRKVLTINTDYRFATRTTISLTKAWGPADGYTTIELRRVTSTTDRLVDFTDGSILRAYDLNVAQIQTMHVAEEAHDLTADTIGVNNDGHLDARGRRIVNLANAVDDRDAVPFGQLKTMNQNSWQARNEALQFRNEANEFRNEAEQFKNTSGQYAESARTSLLNLDSAGMIGSANYADIRSYRGASSKISCYGRSAIRDGGNGLFVRDDSDVTSADNGGTILVDALGRRWKRANVNSVELIWFCEKGDGVKDYTSILQSAIQFALDNGLDLVFDGGVYPYTTLQVMASTARKAQTRWVARTAVTFISTKTSPDASNYDADYGIRVSGVFHSQVSLTADALKGAGVVIVSDATNIDEGDLIVLQSTRLIQTDHRGQAREGQVCKVRNVTKSANRVGLYVPLKYYAPTGIFQHGTVTDATSGAQFTASGLSLNRRNSNVRIRFTSGSNAGQVRYVTGFSGDTVYIGGRQSPFPSAPSAGDTFNLEWQTDVSVIKPLKFEMVGTFINKREVTLNAAAGSVGFRGWDFVMCDNPIVDDLRAEGFSETGIRFRTCYGFLAKSLMATDANRAYNRWDGTGYGISINQCYGGTVLSWSTYRCRRGLDVSGTQAISWDCNIASGKATGGGVSYQGEAFWPVGPAENSGFGSHGGGYGTRYTNNTVTDCHLPIALRGLRERVLDCEVLGYVADTCLLIRHGGGHVVDGLIYDDMYSEIGHNSATSYGVESRAGTRPAAVISLSVDPKDGYLTGYPMIFRNCQAKRVTLSFLRVIGSGSGPYENISLGNNVVWASNEGTSTVEFSFVRTKGSKIARNLTDLGGNRMFLASGEYVQWCMYDLRVGAIMEDNTYLRLADNKVFGTIADDGFIAIPISTRSKTAMISVFDHEINRNYRAASMMLGVGLAVDFSPLQATNKFNVEVTNVPLTGTTGTDGKLTVAFLPTGGGGMLYIENRMGGVVRPCIVIDTVPF